MLSGQASFAPSGRRRRFLAGVAILLVLATLGPMPLSLADTVVDLCGADEFEGAFEEAIFHGGRIVLACPQTNFITRTMVIARDTEIEDSTGVGWISGVGSNRLFHILTGVRLTLTNVRLTGGRGSGAAGADGTANQDGGSGGEGFGGAVYNEGGTLNGTGVTFSNHQADGGDGGAGANVGEFGAKPTPGGNGGSGRGGAIFSQGGTVALTNCVFDTNRADGGRGGEGGSGSDFTRDGADGGNAGVAAGGAIFVTSDGILRLIGCTLKNNSASGASGGLGGIGAGLIYFDGRNGNSTSGRGGAIALDEGGADLVGCTFSDNSASGADGLSGSGNAIDRSEASGGDGRIGRGGALDMTLGTLVVTSTTFTRNHVASGNGGDGGLTSGFGDGGDGGGGATGQGGAVALSGSGTAVFTDSAFSRNDVVAGFGGFGAIGASDVAFVGRDGNAGAGQGGGLHVDSGNITLQRCTFEANSATGGEGLEGVGGTTFASGHPGNPGGAAAGGGLFAQSGQLLFTNATFYANRAIGGPGGRGGNGVAGGLFATDGGNGGDGGPALGGGAWFGEGASASLHSCTFATNTVTGGVGGTNGLAGDPELARPGNPGSAGLSAGGALSASSSVVTIRSTLLAHSGPGGNVDASIVDAGHNLCTDTSLMVLEASTRVGVSEPGLSPLAGNGGPTRTVALNPESPALDAGATTDNPEVDQRGYLRDSLPDIGAYEAGVSGLTPLDIEMPGSGEIVISWPNQGVNYTLESTPSLDPAAWKGIGGAVIIGDRWVFTNSASSSQQYFRLRY